MLLDRLQALLVRFYSKNEAADKAEIAQLGTLDWSKLVMLNDVSSASAIDSGAVAPGNGVLFSMIENYTTYNGISRASGDWCSIVNFSDRQAGANTCVNAVVAKGDTVVVHNSSAQTSTRKWYFVPFLGGGVKKALDRIGGGLCLGIASTVFCALRSRLPLRARARSLKPSLQARKSSSRLLTDMPLLSPVMSTASTRSTSKTTACSLSYLRTCLRGLARGYLAGRDKPSGSRSMERRIQLCDSSPVSLSLDGLATGGAA